METEERNINIPLGRIRYILSKRSTGKHLYEDHYEIYPDGRVITASFNVDLTESTDEPKPSLQRTGYINPVKICDFTDDVLSLMAHSSRCRITDDSLNGILEFFFRDDALYLRADTRLSSKDVRISDLVKQLLGEIRW